MNYNIEIWQSDTGLFISKARQFICHDSLNIGSISYHLHVENSVYIIIVIVFKSARTFKFISAVCWAFIDVMRESKQFSGDLPTQL